MADYTVRGDTRLDAGGFNSGLSKLSGLAKSGLGAIATAGAAAAAAVAGVAVASVNLASDLNEVQNVVKVTFGEKGAAQIEEWAKAARDAYGLSELAAKQYTGTLGAMLKSMGLTDDAIMKMSTDMVGLAGDFASFYNLDAATAFEKIRSGISGETEPLKQLGINMSVANLEAFALSQGITEAYKDMDQASQATLRYNYLMSVTKDAQGDFANTQGSLANQMRIATLQVQEMGAAIGTSLLPMATEALQVGNEMLSALQEGFESGGMEGLLQAAEGAVTQLATTIAGKLPAMVDAAVGLLGALATGLYNAAPSILSAGAEVVESLAQAIAEHGPDLLEGMQGALSGIISAVGTYGPQLLQQGLAIVQQLGQGLVQGIPNFLANALPLLLSFTEGLRQNFGTIVDAGLEFLLNLVKGIMNSLPTLIQYIPQIVTNIAGLINDNAPKVLAAGVKLLGTLARGIVQAIPALIANIPYIIQAIVAVITAFNWLNLGANILTSIGKGITSMGGAIKTAVSNGMRGAIDFLKALPKQALQWGKDFIAGLINGIKSKIGDVVGAIGDVVGAIASMIHFSRPDTGPLRPYEKWMPDFMDGLALGVERNAPKVTGAVAQLAQDMVAAAEKIGATAQAQAGNAAQLQLPDREPTGQTPPPVPVQKNQTINFYEPVQSPDEVARRLRIEDTYGLAGDRDG